MQLELTEKQKNRRSNVFFLLSFLPAVAYWYLESRYSIAVALVGGIGLAILEMALEKWYFKKIHGIAKLNFILIVLLGSIALWFQDGLLFKLQPFFTGVFIGPFLIWRTRRQKSFMAEVSETLGEFNPAHYPAFLLIEGRMGMLLLGYSLWMGFVALNFTTSQWLFFKTIGFYVVFILFILAHYRFLAKNFAEDSKKS